MVLTGEFAGNYTANGTYRGKPDFFSTDGLHNLYFEEVVRRQRDRALAALEDDHVAKGAMSRSGEGCVVIVVPSHVRFCWFLLYFGGGRTH